MDESVIYESVRLYTYLYVVARLRRSEGVYSGRMAWGNRADRIDHEGPRFVWQQIADDIAADIRSGALPANSRLPAEQDLAADVYGVARATVRRAIASLAEEGLILVMHGRGTFVAEQPQQ